MRSHQKYSLLALLMPVLNLSADPIVLYSQDFETYAVDTPLTNQSPYWTPNWNAGDIVRATVTLDGPNGLRAFNRSTQVIAGRFYGGGIRGGSPSFEIPANGSSSLEDITLRIWIKGTSSQSRGPVGLSVISKDAGGADTGAVYYKLPIVPAEWTEFAIPFSSMDAGIPNHGTAGTGFDPSSPRVQVFIWMRTEYEDGWPFQEAEDHTYSVSIANVRITTEASGDPPPEFWGEFEIVNEWVDTEDWLGLLWVGAAPWVYSYDLNRFLFFPEEPESSGAWIYMLR